MKYFTICFVFYLAAFISAANAQNNLWEKINFPYTEMGSVLAVSPGGSIFVGSNSAVLRSSDNGLTWNVSNLGLSISILDIAFNSNSTAFCAGFGGVFRSTDDGLNWTKIYDGQPIKSISVSESGHIFIGWGHETSGGILRSTDNGVSWINTGLEANSYAISINAAGTIFSGGWHYSGRCIFRSTDNGGSWNDSVFVLADGVVSRLKISPTGKIFAATSQKKIYRSTDNGANWSQVHADMFVSSFAFNSTGHIFAGTYDEGVFRSSDGGTTWTSFNTGLTNDSVSSIDINTSGVIFASTAGGLYRSVQFPTSSEELRSDLSFSLYQNYPNPFNPTTKINYQIPADGVVSLKVYDVLGKEILTLINDERAAGFYEVDFSPAGLSSGIYFYKLQTEGFTSVKKMIFLK